mmetsp:Transcript_23221/g.22287  ORF Transcript_23221/g.22287 Transcript_23221/m.22287 type:complete len:118 (-) Transcript_23221:301-654(-)|eukprot:CAMPEP_0197831894 /NCGR_PEP_ID=MMETSP1437-20131217/12609_1 /TAXON_ID=49252 ORGANISM="Eucampia antarctica, Strain CCMP1452" /NCGR_SAMPLE_ID=MMETSP1437 /ASSEMBLY_ACC=CAM_ASM_001096 /LENGTH=117 /DNA_ID=CAMNT_0043435015 /DNA_START=183 /DNA_END=536 /DNA_ORIENTATION=+
MTLADSVNVARRLSSHGENDLMQEQFIGAEENERLNCEALAEKLTSVKDLPRECLAYNAVVNSVLRRSKTSDNAIAFQGMQSGSATSAMAARGKGKESFAQIQRRYTNSRRFSKQEK